MDERIATGVAVLAAIGLFGGGVGMPERPKGDPRPTIVVIGGGVSAAADEATGGDQSSGAALVDGFRSAWQTTDGSLRKKVAIEWIDDHNSAEQAAGEARRLARRPEVLAVVGFTQSNTAAAALPFLRMAGVPVLLPIATSIELGRDPVTGELMTDRNEKEWGLVRLIADDACQALAIEMVMQQGKRANDKPWQRILLVREEGERASGYVDALAYMLEKRLGSKIVAQVKLQTFGDLEMLRVDASAQKAHAVCFLGYPEMGRRVLFSLRADEEGRSLPVIMPDACARLLSEEAHKEDPELFVTFPVDASSPGAPGVGDSVKTSFKPSAWRAAELLAEHLGARPLSRRTLRRDLPVKSSTDYSVVHRKSGEVTITPLKLNVAGLDQLRVETARRAGRSSATSEVKR